MIRLVVDQFYFFFNFDSIFALFNQVEKFHHEKHDTIYELLTELIRNDPECVTHGQANQLITLATEERSLNRLKLIGALCAKYQAEIVDHLLSSVLVWIFNFSHNSQSFILEF